MRVITEDDPCPERSTGTIVTIGAYDGVHRGHRAVIGGVRELASSHDAASAVVTFDRHPATVVRPESAPKLLTDLDQKLELLDATGVDLCVVVRFDQERAAQTAEDFVRATLVDCLAARTIVVGEDFHFGKGRTGNVGLLRDMGALHGFDVTGLTLVSFDDLVDDLGDRPVSSTVVRSALASGDVAAAGRMLGRPHEVRGLVQTGDQRGRDLGFPTANVAVPEQRCLPADGIYAGWYERPDGTVHAAAISLGRRPTFYEKAESSLLEAHLLDFSGDLYGEVARVRFVKRLRGEVKFDGVEALVRQIELDVVATRAALAPAH